MPAWIRLPVRVTSGLSEVVSAGWATKAEQPPKKMEVTNREERRSVFLLVIYFSIPMSRRSGIRLCPKGISDLIKYKLSFIKGAIRRDSSVGRARSW